MADIAEKGKRVKVHYTGTLEDGTQFDSSKGKDPLAFRVGAGEMIKGFDIAVTGMKVGETKTITLAPEDAYGDRDEKLLQDVPKAALAGKIDDPKKGMNVALKSPDGQMMVATISKIEGENVTFDLNPPLAGKTLTFEIELVSVE